MLLVTFMKIIKMDNQGRGITYFNDKIVFVNNTLPGEDVDIEIIIDKKKYSIANVKKFNIKSNNRIKPKCRYCDTCGGCQLQHITYDNQIKYKEMYLNELFKSLNIKIEAIELSSQFNYRNKIKFQVNNEIGLYKMNSNEIVKIEKCEIANENINKKIKYINKLNMDGIDNIIIKSFDEKVMLVINGDENKINIDDIYNSFDSIYINNNLAKGKRIIAQINNIKYLISPNSFFQVNIEVASKMFNYIKEICNYLKSKNVIDLYCGCGSISIYISSIVNYVYGIEINEDSIKDANKNKLLNNINNVDFECNTSDNININDKYDTLIVDPPRSGLSKKIINKVLSSTIKNIIYVSCDPITLKRDLELLSEKYKIKSIKPFDMFPNTYHIECVCILSLNIS